MNRRNFFVRTLWAVAAVTMAPVHRLAEDTNYRIPHYHASLDPRWFVDTSVAVSGDGTSPERAFRTLAEAVNRVSSDSTIIILSDQARIG